MKERDFKHLLIDLEVEHKQIAEAVGISSWAVSLYFRGELRSRERREQIKAFLRRKAREQGFELPVLWPDPGELGGMTEREISHLLVDLDLTLHNIAEAAGVSSWRIPLYFRGELRSPARRRQIKAFLIDRAREKGVDLPEFWPDAEAA